MFSSRLQARSLRWGSFFPALYRPAARQHRPQGGDLFPRQGGGAPQQGAVIGDLGGLLGVHRRRHGPLHVPAAGKAAVVAHERRPPAVPQGGRHQLRQLPAPRQGKGHHADRGQLRVGGRGEGQFVTGRGHDGAKQGATEAQKSAATTARGNIASLRTEALTNLDLLKGECEAAESKSGGSNLQWLGPTIGAVTTGALGGFLFNKATRDIQASNLSSAEKAAYEEWMNNVGRHIKCYIGTDEAGEYGDILSVSME